MNVAQTKLSIFMVCAGIRKHLNFCTHTGTTTLSNWDFSLVLWWMTCSLYAAAEKTSHFLIFTVSCDWHAHSCGNNLVFSNLWRIDKHWITLNPLMMHVQIETSSHTNQLFLSIIHPLLPLSLCCFCQSVSDIRPNLKSCQSLPISMQHGHHIFACE